MYGLIFILENESIINNCYIGIVTIVAYVLISGYIFSLVAGYFRGEMDYDKKKTR